MLDRAINANAETVRKGKCRASIRWLLGQLRYGTLPDQSESYRRQIHCLWGDR